MAHPLPYTVVFLWISAAAPRAPALADIADFGAARGVTLTPLAAAPRRAGSMAYDSVRVDGVEAELEQARTALSALEEDAAEQRLARAEATLLAHPHLPQAGFLMAECLALRAALVRPRDAALAEQLEASRAALEGPRALAFGDVGSLARATLPAPVALRVSGLSRLDELEVDGRVVPRGAALELAPGLHHVRVWRSERVLFATFARVAAGQTELALPVPALQPCDADDLQGVVDGAELPTGIACNSWALVRSEGTGIGVAMCSGSRCGSFVHWQRRRAEPFTTTASPRSQLPPWATFAIAGVATAAATGLVLWQSGALERGNPSATRFRYDGVGSQALRF